jgi:hypothetical protein
MEKEFPIEELDDLRSSDLDRLDQDATRLESIGRRARAAVVK